MPVNVPTFRPAAQQSRQEQKRDYDRFRRKAKPWRRYYNTSAWQALRRDQLARQPLCERCQAEGLIVLATVANHKQRHHGDWELFVGGELQSLCKRCHDSDVQREERAETLTHEQRWGYSIPHGVKPSGVPVHLVCGAPGAGKSTYVREHAQRGDTIIDMDEIRQSLGFERYSADPAHLKQALVERDRRLHALAGLTFGQAWLILMAPTDDERAEWVRALGTVTVHQLHTSADECKRRVMLDPSREGHRDRLMRAIDVYFVRRFG